MSSVILELIASKRFAALYERCLQHELEVGGVLTDSSENDYSLLLLSAALTNDSLKCKLVWKRIPLALKKKSAVIALINKMVSLVCSGSVIEFYGVFSSSSSMINSSPILSAAAKALRDETTIIQSNILKSAFLIVHINDYAARVGIHPDEAARRCVSEGWTLEGDGFIRAPTSTKVDVKNKYQLSAEHIDRLTAYITHLEQA